MSTPPPPSEDGGPAAPTPRDLTALHAMRRVYLRRRVAAGLIVCAIVAGAIWGGVVLVGVLDRPSAAVANAAPSPDPSPPSPPPNHDFAGALGDIATMRACRLLSPTQIAHAFGRQEVSPPYATYPFCQWLVGSDTFLALGIRPATSIMDVRSATSVVQEAPGIAADAFFGSDRYLYFGDARTTYWLQYEQVGAFTGIHVDELERLARTVWADAPPPPAKQAPPAVKRAPPPVGSPALRKGTAADPLRVWFAGDSLAAGPSWALFELTKGDPTLSVIPEYQVGTGLVRGDYFDWTRHAAGVMTGIDPDIAIYMGGANDNQEILVHGRYQAVGDPAWTREFSRRVGAMMDVMTQDGRPVIWMGMPPMQNPTLDHGMRAVDAAYAAEAQRHPLVTYIDAYAIFGAQGGSGYTDSMRFHGQRQVVRLADGIHLNGVGSTVAADAILKQLRALIRS